MNSTVTGRIDDRLDTRSVDPAVRGGMQTRTLVADPVSWGAILVGSLGAIAIGAMLNVLGIAIGAASVDATAGATPTAQSVGISGGIWLAAANAIGLLIGGMLAARLAASWRRSDSVLHGIGVWAVASLISLVILGSAVTNAGMSVARGASSAAGSIVEAAGSAGGAVAQQLDPAALADRLRRLATAPADPASLSPEDIASETGQLLLRRVTQGQWTGEERARLQQLLGVSTGLPPDQVQARLQQIEAQATQQLQEAETAARQAADTAARATSLASFWAFAAMLLGLAAATLGAWLGARSDDHRDAYPSAT